ncbi:GerAB/ArcD/ProY family transporter [Sutcliffiella halmapala]|uniref:GerAB/ArcD/ProY family transporter n=1 Tax=Sutcliffiella halmapala TaxID=79882 RepID=UPI000994F1A4|nr:GerAB/ArcD/ProY family transporter [Sutcliffiella halmapala]
MKKPVQEQYLVSSFFVFFLIHSSQKGIGMLNFQQTAIKYAGQDAWISILLTGLSVHVILWMLYKMLSNPTKDVMEIHRFCFGTYIGNALSIILVVYFLILSTAVVRIYIEILQVWVFPTIKTWELGIVLICLIYYIVSGGFRVITGFSFFGVVIPTILLFTLYYPFRHSQFNYLLPVFNHSFIDIIKSSKVSSIIFIGFEAILVYFPFIKNPKKSFIWSNMAALYTTILYLFVIISSILYFSQGQLEHTIWPTLTMTKIIEIPFIERFEFIFIFIWLLVIIPTTCIPIWCCTRILKKVANIKPRISLVGLLSIILISSILFDDRTKIDFLSASVSEIGLYFVFVYIPCLFLIYMIQTKRTKAL